MLAERVLRCPALLLILTACGGRADQGNASMPEGGEAVVAPASGGEPREAPDPAEQHGGAFGSGTAVSQAGSAVAGSAEAGATSGGGAESDPRPPSIGSGTRYCESDRYCFGLQCYAPEQVHDRVCMLGCEDGLKCGRREEACLQSPDLAPGCYRRCDSPMDCEYGFDCFDFAGQQRMLVCFPTEWAAVWQRQGH